MATPKFDRLCVEFMKRIPDQTVELFEVGEEKLPNGYLLTSETIIDYVNRALMQLFNNYWQATAGDIVKFINVFPELVEMSGAVALNNGKYVIASPYKDFVRLIGAKTSTSNKYIKPKDDNLYALYLSGEYQTFQPTLDNPVIIQVNNFLGVFPTNLSENINIHYIKAPIDPTTGNALIQNGNYDSPYYEHWNNAIVDLAYLKYLQETNDTT